MNLEQHKNIIENSFIIYETIQAEHLSILKDQEMPDLNSMTQERENAFLNLKKNLDNLIGNAGSIGGTKSLPLLTEFESRLNTIMGLDEQIAAEIQRHSVELKKHLKHMKQGKAAMNGYRMAGTNSPKPCVLSMNR
ncbi:MAG: hypothetical protein K8S13_12945 [Desulfobacula sp.]|uniref:hypothetical protein n=1 Tax=Desulfobacula sp. TaxID=2593537 RepID=UPI0025B960DC|nr:hypothetical protein [Desulfobacula sp.]MCD4720744.1 hypothetical protein [Desulfobacula sp.]